MAGKPYGDIRSRIPIGVCGAPGCVNPSCSIPYGFCHCGCGRAVLLARHTATALLAIKDKPRRYARGHGGAKAMPSGEKHPNWLGGRIVQRGYWSVWVGRDHPMANAKGRAYEHRLVMAEHVGRPLLREETVHHINGDPLDNRIENLQLRTQHHGPGQIRACGDCGSRNIVCLTI